MEITIERHVRIRSLVRPGTAKLVDLFGRLRLDRWPLRT
jgi:hypothetical protein